MPLSYLYVEYKVRSSSLLSERSIKTRQVQSKGDKTSLTKLTSHHVILYLVLFNT